VAETPATDPILLLIQRVSEMQINQGEALRAHAAAQHEISTALAVLNTRLEPLTSLTSEMRSLQLKVGENGAKLVQHGAAISAMTNDLDALKTSNSARGGWEGVLGKVGMVFLGAAVALAAGSIGIATRAQGTPHYTGASAR
jgi:hypothetical protein